MSNEQIYYTFFLYVSLTWSRYSDSNGTKGQPSRNVSISACFFLSGKGCALCESLGERSFLRSRQISMEMERSTFFFVGHCLWVCDEFGFSIFDEYVINCCVSYELAEWHRQSSGGGRNSVARNEQEAWQEQCGWIECAQQKCIMFNKNVERDDDGLWWW